VNLTNSQIAEMYVFNTYPCLQSWINFIQPAISKIAVYDTTSCTQLAMISRAAMKTFDYICAVEPNASVIRVSRMLANLAESAWQAWVTFSAQSKITNGDHAIQITSDALQGLTSFNNWDIVLNPIPKFDPPSLFDLILRGTTL
jgi:hypothetical protein